MSILKVTNLQKNFGPLSVLSGVSFSLEKGQKVALIGHNGTGKTTLLKILAGLEDSDGGDVEILKDAHVGYLPQDTSLQGDETIIDYLRRGCSAITFDFDHRAEVMLSGFGMDNIHFAHKLSELSSGQKSKVALAGILLKGVDLLLLDEPTNNLDLPSLVWLESFLSKTDAACIVVSHDRRFLDRTVKKILELDWNTHEVLMVNGTYSQFMEMQAKKIAHQKEEYRLQKEEIARLETSARDKRADAAKGAKYVGSDNDKFLKGFKRDRAGGSSRVAKTIDKRIEKMDKVERPIERDPLEIVINSETKSGTLDIRLRDVVAGYSNGFKIGPVSFEARFGNRIGIMGLNGVGKSTLLKTITGNLAPLSGTIEIGSGIKFGNMMQEHETLPRTETPLQFLQEKVNLSIQSAYAKLVKFGLDEKQAKVQINTLSPGERARLLLAYFSAQAINTLVLDEPTNHLDFEALEALEETLKIYKGTVLLVSHDRYFLEKASLDTVYVLSEKTLTKIPDYQEYERNAEEKARKLIKLL